MKLPLAAMLLAALWSASVHAAFDVRVSAADSQVWVAPGGTATLSLGFANAGDAASPAGFAFDFYVDRYEDPLSYTFAVNQPGPCSPFTPLPGLSSSFRFELAALPPGETVECIVSIGRSATSKSDVRIVVKQDQFDFTAGNSVERYAGQPVAGVLRAEKAGDILVTGHRAEQLVRLSFHNPGPVDLQRVSFGYCTTEEYAAPETGFPGACLASDEPYGICFSGSKSFEFARPVRAGETANCLVRVAAFWPLTGLGGNYLSISSPQSNAAGGWTAILDDGPRADLTIRNADIVASRHPIPASSTLALVILSASAFVLASRRRLSDAKAGA